MQTSKFVFAVSALAVLVLPLQTQAGPDNPEQAKMRAALRRMMEQMATTSTTPPPAPAKTEVVPVPPPAPAPAPVVATQPVPAAYDSVPPPNDPAKVAQEREAMRQKLAASQAPPTSTPVVPTSPVAPAPVASATVKPVAPAPVAPPPAEATPPSYTQVEAPASPLPATKQTRLADLLAKYRADTITAQEYHTTRAAILAEP